MLSKYADLSPEHEAIVASTIGCAIAVHRELGPGFKESIYHTAFRLELERGGISFESEKRDCGRIGNGPFPAKGSISLSRESCWSN